MSDPSAMEDDECGEITASQEQILLNAPFLDPNPHPPAAPLLSSSSSSSSSDDDDDDAPPGDSRKRPRSDEILGLGDSSQRRKPDQYLEMLQDIFGNSRVAASGSASGTRKLAASIPSKLLPEGVNARSGSEANAGAYPATLGDAVEMLSDSGKRDDKLADMDILEVLAMRGIVIPNPSWWPPGGYPDP